MSGYLSYCLTDKRKSIIGQKSLIFIKVFFLNKGIEPSEISYLSDIKADGTLEIRLHVRESDFVDFDKRIENTDKILMKEKVSVRYSYFSLSFTSI